MVPMWMMQVSVDQIVYMVAVWYGLMPAIRPVNMFRVMSVRTVCAFIGVCGTDANRVLIHMVAVRVMQMAVVQIIHMTLVLDGGVSAAGAVNVGMIGVGGAGMLLAHRFISFVLGLRV
jgi:hypothetical protein